VEYFIYGCNLIKNYARWTREIKSDISLAKTTFYKKKTLFTSQLDLNLRNKLPPLEHSFVMCWNWTRRRVDKNYLESVQMWCWKRMEKIS
jgi:hypothetical protein